MKVNFWLDAIITFLMTTHMTLFLHNIVLKFIGSISFCVVSTQMNTLFGQMGVLHNSNLRALGIMWPSDIFLALVFFLCFWSKFLML
jgi:hypothetical protein